MNPRDVLLNNINIVKANIVKADAGWCVAMRGEDEEDRTNYVFRRSKMVLMLDDMEEYFRKYNLMSR